MNAATGPDPAAPGGSITNAGEFEVTDLYTLSAGTLVSSLSGGLGVATFAAGSLAQSGGTFTTQGMGMAEFPVAIAALTQTGGTLSIEDYPSRSTWPAFTTSAAAAQASIRFRKPRPIRAAPTANSSCGPRLPLGGIVAATDGIHITSGVATLAGTLEIVASGEFEPFTYSPIGTFGSRVGTFDTLIVPSAMDIWYTSTGFGAE